MRWIERLLDKNVKLQTYESLSGSWPTCAVGEKHADMPDVVVDIDGSGQFVPADDKLTDLGYKFHNAVARGHRNKALALYDQIDARVRELIRIRARAKR